MNVDIFNEKKSQYKDKASKDNNNKILTQAQLCIGKKVLFFLGINDISHHFYVGPTRIIKTNYLLVS